jgi:hypothetical protein
MPLQKPVEVYTAGTDLEAHVIHEMLTSAGVEAAIMGDVAWLSGGVVPQIQHPRIFVDEADADRARTLLAEYEQRQQREETVGDGPLIPVLCEECRRTTMFAASLRGRVEVCSHCGAYVDVGDDPGFDDWQTLPAEGDEP